MECGAAGVATVRIGAKVTEGQSCYYTDIYSSGLNVGAKNLVGYAGALHFTLDDQGYSIGFFPGSNSTSRHFSLVRYGRTFTCQEIR